MGQNRASIREFGFKIPVPARGDESSMAATG
jgi:hypothetical protein